MLRGKSVLEDMRTPVVNLERLSVFAPSRSQPQPGDEQLWQAWKFFKPVVR